MKRSLVLRVLAVAMSVPVAGGVLAGCKKKEAPAPTTVVVHTYTVRAQVEQLPDPNDIRKEFMARHEKIPEFKGPGGEIGMNAMVMPFPIAEGVSLEGLKVGDKLEVTFAVDFDTVLNRPRKYAITSWKPLPAETALDFR